MTKPVSQLYLQDHGHLNNVLKQTVAKGIAAHGQNPVVFFRADDIGIPSKQYTDLIQLFTKHQIPLALAVVPSWLNEERRNHLFDIAGKNPSLWCWHQHGTRHVNHETQGKKQEFGSARTEEEIQHSLSRGKSRLATLLGDDFTPIFTPPWNRCSQQTLQQLIELRFLAISRSSGARPLSPASLPDLQVNVDLHTRKENSPQKALTNLLSELEHSLATGWCGIMLHHQRMNARALLFLDILLKVIRSEANLSVAAFPDLIERAAQRQAAD